MPNESGDGYSEDWQDYLDLDDAMEVLGAGKTEELELVENEEDLPF